MPWSSDNVPTAASKLKGKQLKTFVAAANSALKEGYSDEEAIKIGLADAKKINKSLDFNLGNIGNNTLSSGKDAGDIMKDIEKMLADDKRQALQSHLRTLNDKFYVIDYDEEASIVYFEKWDDGSYDQYKTTYTASDDYSNVTVNSNFTEIVVEYKREYKTISKKFVSEVVEGIAKHFGGTQRKADPVETLVVIKQFDESNDEMIEISKLYCGPMEVDAHDDAMTEEEIRKMVANLDSNIQKGKTKGNFDHDPERSTDKFSFLKAFVAECDCTIGGNYVAEGTPLIKIKYHDADLWKERKEGGYTGWSIGAKAKSVEYIEVDV